MNRLTEYRKDLKRYEYKQDEKGYCFIQEGQIINKLGKLEDLFEKYNVENIEELEKILKIFFLKDKGLEFDIGDLITFDNPASKYIESSSDIRKINTLYEVIGYNNPNNIKVKIIKDRNRESNRIVNINLLTEYPYITKVYI